MTEGKWLKDGIVAGAGCAGALTALHLTLYDPEVGVDDQQSLSRLESCAVGVATLISGLYLWSRCRPEAPASAAVIVLIGEACVSGVAMLLLHAFQRAAELCQARAVRDHLEQTERERRRAPWSTTSGVRPPEA